MVLWRNPAQLQRLTDTPARHPALWAKGLSVFLRLNTFRATFVTLIVFTVLIILDTFILLVDRSFFLRIQHALSILAFIVIVVDIADTIAIVGLFFRILVLISAIPGIVV